MQSRLLGSAALLLCFGALSYGTDCTSTPTQCAVASNGGLVTDSGDQGNATNTQTFTAQNMSGVVSNVTITLTNWNLNGATGDFPGDFYFELVAPSGQAFDFLGEANDTCANPQPTFTISFADGAAATIPDGCSNFSWTFTSGTTYAPFVSADSTNQCPDASGSHSGVQCAANYAHATFESAFGGATPNGTWTVYAYDPSADDKGSIQSLTLTITTEASESSTTTTLGGSANQAFTTSPNNSITYTATVKSGGTGVNEGVVQFYDNGSTLGSPVAVNGSGEAQYQDIFSSSTPEGLHSVTASYTDTASNPKYAASNSDGSPVQVFIDNHTSVNGSSFCNNGTINMTSDLAGNNTTQPYPQHVYVSGVSGSLASVTLQINNITTGAGDSYLGDMDFLLVGPDGASYVPVAETGSVASGVSGLTLTLADSGASYLPNGSNATSGTYKPTDYNSTLSFPNAGSASIIDSPPASGYNVPASQGSATLNATFASENLSNPSQPWSLYAASRTSDFFGTIGGYCLTFTTGSSAATTTTAGASPNPAASGSSVTLTAHVTAGGNNVTTGTVTFFSNGAQAGSAQSLNGSGQASVQQSFSEGAYNVTAEYSGAQAQYTASQGSTSLEVDNATTMTNNGNNSFSFCNPGPLNIGANTVPVQYPSRVFVTGLAGVISTLGVSVDGITYPTPSDLEMLLEGPGGATNNIVFWGNIGDSSASSLSDQSFTIEDGHTALPSTGSFSGGTYGPAAYSGSSSISFPSPAPPAGDWNYAQTLGTASFASQFSNAAPNGAYEFFVYHNINGSTGTIGSHCVNITVTPPVLTLSASHTGNFTQGDSADTYTITVSNPRGPGSTAGTLTLADTLPSGFTASAMAQSSGGTGSDWTCTVATTTCTRTTPMAPGETDAITLTVSIAYTAATGANAVINSATVSGGGISSNQTANDPTTVNGAPIRVSFSTTPTGLSYSVDGTTYSSAQALTLVNGSQHTISTTSPQTSSGTQSTFARWSDSGAISHSITISSTNGTASYAATFNTSYLLTTSASPSNEGSASPSSGAYYASGTVVNLSATANLGYNFSSWTGSVANANSASTTVTMSGPQTVTANFAVNNVNATVNTAPQGLMVSIDGGAAQAAPVSVTWQAGSNHTIAASSPQGSNGTQYAFSSWSDAGAQSHQVTASPSTISYTAAFAISYLLTTAASPSNGGTASPLPGYYPAGTIVNLNATTAAGYKFSSWAGSVANTGSASTTVTLNAPQTVTANFLSNYVPVVVQTSPAGLLISIDGGAPQAAPVNLTWLAGTQHTLATVSPQPAGIDSMYGFSGWSDSGSISHGITAPASPTTYTATFGLDYQLITFVSPWNAGAVATNSYMFYPAGTVVNVSAQPYAGYQFNNWTGSVAQSGAASTTVTMNGPQIVTANYTEKPTTLSARLSGEGGPPNARYWTLATFNSGPGAANRAELSSLKLTQTAGIACSAALESHIPIELGSLPPLGFTTASILINFSGCSQDAQFTLDGALTANQGGAAGVLHIARAEPFRPSPMRRAPARKTTRPSQPTSSQIHVNPEYVRHSTPTQ